MDKLTPAPWYGENGYCVYGPTSDEDKRNGDVLFEGKHLAGTDEDMRLCARARNFLDILLETRWAVLPHGEGWYAAECGRGESDVSYPVIPWKRETGPVVFAEPITAVLAAWEWQKGNKKP